MAKRVPAVSYMVFLICGMLLYSSCNWAAKAAFHSAEFALLSGNFFYLNYFGVEEFPKYKKKFIPSFSFPRANLILEDAFPEPIENVF